MSGEVVLLRRDAAQASTIDDGGYEGEHEAEEEEQEQEEMEYDNTRSWERTQQQQHQQEELGPAPQPPKASDFVVQAPIRAHVVARVAQAAPRARVQAPLQARPVPVQHRPLYQPPPAHFPHLDRIVSAPSPVTYMSPQYRQYPDLHPVTAAAPPATTHYPPRMVASLAHPSAPVLSAASTSTSSSNSANAASETETETDTDSEIASEAAAYVNRSRDAYDALERARRKGGVVGLRESLSPYDFTCPHCVDMQPERSAGAIVSFSCCLRRAHYSCMSSIQNIHELARQGVPACIQCLRPAKLLPHQVVLDRYREELTRLGQIQANQAKKPRPPKKVGRESDRKGRMASLWTLYEKLGTSLSQRGLVAGIKDVIKPDEQRSNPPMLDVQRMVEQGITTRDLLRAGWNLETIAEELELHRIAEEDEYDEDWKRIGFDRNALLELGDADMLYLMSAYDLHPYQLRRHFDIRLYHLWRSAERRRMGGRGSSSRSRSPADLSSSGGGGGGAAQGNGQGLGQAVQARFKSADRAEKNKRARGAARDFRTTEQICQHHGVLSPRQLAILGFDLHHMLVMGFSKDHFRNFPYFTMDDWITHLGFRKPHWNLLRLCKEDFAPKRGCFAGLVGWKLDTLKNRWGASPNELCEMGMITDEQVNGMLDPSPPAAAAPAAAPAPHPSQAPSPYYHYYYHYPHQQQPQPRYAARPAYYRQQHQPPPARRARAPQRPRYRRARRPHPQAVMWRPKVTQHQHQHQQQPPRLDEYGIKKGRV